MTKKCEIRNLIHTKQSCFAMFFSLIMLFTDNSAFADEVEYSGGFAFGIEAGLGVVGNGPLNYGVANNFDRLMNFSASIQLARISGSLGLSLDWITGNEQEYISSDGWNSYTANLINSGYCFSLFYEFLKGKSNFTPYLGAGLGFLLWEENGSWATEEPPFEDSLAWKLDAGVFVWLYKSYYIKTGVTYDNVRNGLSVTMGIGLTPHKSITAMYIDENGKPFPHKFTISVFAKNVSPDFFYSDNFDYSEVVDRKRVTTRKSLWRPGVWDSGAGLTAGRGWVRDAKTETVHYVHDVTVTRNWYTRTYYYKDRKPTTEKFYQDSDSAVLVDSY
ncbi:MAG: hypothetical protein Pg6A_07690 [Termitinemataceae bacterium]|nr:MAG: hypothetical protein Pg6A_07690 [Termitinemataceae bacterium]